MHLNLNVQATNNMISLLRTFHHTQSKKRAHGQSQRGEGLRVGSGGGLERGKWWWENGDNCTWTTIKRKKKKKSQSSFNGLRALILPILLPFWPVLLLLFPLFTSSRHNTSLLLFRLTKHTCAFALLFTLPEMRSPRYLHGRLFQVFAQTSSSQQGFPKILAMGWMLSPKKLICWNLNPQGPGMWLY